MLEKDQPEFKEKREKVTPVDQIAWVCPSSSQGIG
jgi:hypothetical protein